MSGDGGEVRGDGIRAQDPHAEAMTPLSGTPVTLGPSDMTIHVRRGRDTVISYGDIVHVDLARRGLAISTRSRAFYIRRNEFSEPGAMRVLYQALRTRIGARPGGAESVSRMDEIDRLEARRRPKLAVYAFALLCLMTYVLQELDPFAISVGAFSPALVSLGEYWRLVTANFLHNMLLFPFHIGMNVFCVVVFGFLTERVLGSLRTVVVMGVSGISAMLAAGAMGYPEVVGASGVAAGLAGALVSMELGGGKGLPAWWRIPRFVFVAALGLQVAFDFFIPFVAGAAHVGGFVAGFLASRALLDGALHMRVTGPITRGVAFGLVAMLVLSVIEAAPLLTRDPVALESHGLRRLQSMEVSGYRDNELAWRMLTESELTERGTEVALALAERAADVTQWRNPDVLDTLAEALFAVGDRWGALRVIDQAIALTGGADYFIQQRRRFTGERSAEDRPDPPSAPWLPGPESDPEFDHPEIPGEESISI